MFYKKKIFIVLVLFQVFFIVYVVKIGINDLTTTRPADDNGTELGTEEFAWRKNETNTTKPEANKSSQNPTKWMSSFTIIPEIPKDTTLLIVINTIPSKLERRDTLRETWAKRTTLSNNPSSKPHKNMTVAYFFSVGFEGTSAIDTKITGEAYSHKDILRVDCNETYRGILAKVLLTFEWIASLETQPRFIVKADDDVYIKVPDLARWLLGNAVQPVKRLYAGFVHIGVRVVRVPNSPWYVSSEQYKNDYFPSYCAGPFYVLSRNVFLEVLNASKVTKMFLVEDAYIGVLVNKIGAEPMSMGGKLFSWNRGTNHIVLAGKKRIPAGIVLGDSLSSEAIRKLHRTYGGTDSQSMSSDPVSNMDT